MAKKYFKQIDDIIKRNTENRGLHGLSMSNELEISARELLRGTTILIVTGFCIRDTLTCETDGPIGAVSLAYALEKLGKKVILIADKYSERVLQACCEEKKIDGAVEVVPFDNTESFCIELLKKYKPSHIVAIERPGRAKDGCCYSMRGENLSDLIPNTDILFEMAKIFSMTTIAVGDGGNEIGMGKISKKIFESVNKGDKICASIAADYLIVAGVSNWGGHALTGALSLLSNTMLLHDSIIEEKLLKAMIDAGSVDGCTKKRELTVDGLSLDENVYVLENIRHVVASKINRNKKIRWLYDFL